jgi:hypothetical protein
MDVRPKFRSRHGARSFDSLTRDLMGRLSRFARCGPNSRWQRRLRSAPVCRSAGARCAASYTLRVSDRTPAGSGSAAKTRALPASLELLRTTHLQLDVPSRLRPDSRQMRSPRSPRVPKFPPDRLAASSAQQFLDTRGLTHLRVRNRADLLTLKSGDEAESMRHARLRHDTEQYRTHG